MSSEYLQKTSEKYGISVNRAEALWEKAKDAAEKSGNKGDTSYIKAAFKKMLGEPLTMKEHVMLKEYAWETGVMMPNSLKKLLNKLLTNKNLKGAVNQYVEFTKKGMKRSDAIHKAGSMWGFESDKLFNDLIMKLEKNGLLEDTKSGAMFLDLVEGKEGVTVNQVVAQYFIEEDGAPTNTSGVVAPDREHKGKKDVMSRKKKLKKKKIDEEDDSDDDDDNESEEKEMSEGTFRKLSGYLKEAKLPKMMPAAKRKFSKELAKITKTNYFRSVSEPLNDADDALEKLGYKMVNEDGTDFGGFFTGANGRATIDLADSNGTVIDNYIQIQWHKMPSGKYEVNMYMS